MSFNLACDGICEVYYVRISPYIHCLHPGAMRSRSNRMRPLTASQPVPCRPNPDRSPSVIPSVIRLAPINCAEMSKHWPAFFLLSLFAAIPTLQRFICSRDQTNPPLFYGLPQRIRARCLSLKTTRLLAKLFEAFRRPGIRLSRTHSRQN